ncbi:hypothetical protein M0R72_15645 [Candidatus Pacearchaeota archaeon]|jgi:hypothetical protein|nr:hypothetical protein [Candidatus Pacearchaeota archaeon]
MIYGERTRRKMRYDRKGLTGTKIFVADWDDIEIVYSPSLPITGDAWSTLYPFLRCVDIQCDEIGGGLGEVVCQYSTERQLSEGFIETSIDVSLDIADYTEGWVWETAGTPVENSIPSEIAKVLYYINIRLPGPPLAAVLLATGKVNDRKFHGFSIETLKFEGARDDSSYDSAGNVISSQTNYRFTALTRSQQEAWRKPLAKRTAEGNIAYYQDTDSDADFYTTDPTLVGTQVYVTGTAGTGDWDKPTIDGRYRYETCDFEAVLGIPSVPGDD